LSEHFLVRSRYAQCHSFRDRHFFKMKRLLSYRKSVHSLWCWPYYIIIFPVHCRKPGNVGIQVHIVILLLTSLYGSKVVAYLVPRRLPVILGHPTQRRTFRFLQSLRLVTGRPPRHCDSIPFKTGCEKFNGIFSEMRFSPSI
jgi:hypothetical protein